MNDHTDETQDQEFENFDLAQWDEDFVNAPIEDREMDSVPDGKYQVVVDRVELTKSQNTNNTMLKWKLKVLGPKHAGAIIWRNNVLASKSNVKWLKNDLHVCGLDIEKLSELPANMKRLLDVRLEVTKRTKGENENVYFNRLISTAPSGQNDDLDEEMERESKNVFG